MENLLISKNDFDCIGQVARHCDWNQLCIYIREQQNLSLLPIIGHCLFSEIYNNEHADEDDKDEIVSNIWNGGSYTSCAGDIRYHFGLKRSLIHWSYGAYIYKHPFIDTPFGVVQKINNDSIPVEPKELRNLHLDHRNNANSYFSMSKDYICSVKDFLACDMCDCNCVCDHCSGLGKNTQNRGINFDNVNKF